MIKYLTKLFLPLLLSLHNYYINQVMKHYKVTYKLYFNDRLKQVMFHGEATYPLYIQLTFQRHTTSFKSYYFDLLQYNGYGDVNNPEVKPSLKKIMEKEQALMNFLLDELKDNFSRENLKAAYDFYSADLNSVTAEAYRVFMFMFFLQKDKTTLGKALAEGSRHRILYRILSEMEGAFNKSYLEEMHHNALKQRQPYFFLYPFTEEINKQELPVLSIYDWKIAGMQEKFLIWLKDRYEIEQASQIIESVNYWIKQYIPIGIADSKMPH